MFMAQVPPGKDAATDSKIGLAEAQRGKPLFFLIR